MAYLTFSWKRAVPSLLQTEKSECGLACLVMVLNYYGHRTDISAVRARHATSLQGQSLKSLMALADRLQLQARPLRLEPDELRLLQMPAILHWDMNHFVVLAGSTRGRFIIHDPATGIKHFTQTSIGKHFTGVALELTPAPAFTARRDEQRLKFRALWTTGTGLKRSIVQIIVLSLLMQGFALAMPFYTQTVIDDVLVRFDTDLLTILALGFLLIVAINVLTDFIRALVILHMGNRLSFQLAANLNRYLLKLPVDYFGKRHMGDIVSRFGSIFKIRDFITSGIVEVFVDGLMVAGTLVLVLVYSLKLSAVVIAILVLNSLVKFSLYHALRRQNEELIAVSATENSTFMENVRSIQGIKLYGKEADRNTVWQNVFADVTNNSINVQKLNIYIRISRSLIFGVETIAIVFLASHQVVGGAMSIGMMVAFLSYKEQLYKRFFGLIDKYFDYRMLDIHLNRLADIVHSCPEADGAHPSGGGDPHVPAGFLTLQNIAFKYSEESPFLFRNISLTVGEHESVAIIGPTGCGKTTLLKLILSLYRPEAGCISLQGRTITGMGLEQYRGSLSAVLQDDCLLSGSIFENISFFDAQPDRARVELAATQAAIAADIARMPMGYETLVGNMGAALSGGQVQRILLARAFYKNSKLIILDEATSHLDLQTEAAVNRAIKSMNIARIMVAHRPQSFLLADTIYQLGPGGLVKLDRELLLSGRQAGT